MPSDLRMFTRVTYISQGETVSGRNTGVTIAEAAGVATATSAQAHNYQPNQRVYFSGATGGNADTYNDARGFVVLTVPSATTFTFAVPSGTGAGAGTIIADMPIDCVGAQLAAVATPAALTSIALTFQGDIDGSGTFVPIKPHTGTAVSWTVTTSSLYVPATDGQHFGGIMRLKVVGGTAEGGARKLVLSFILTNPY